MSSSNDRNRPGDQRVIPLGGQDDRSLEQFVVGANAELIALLRALVAAPQMMPRLVYIWGESGSGKSHLLHSMIRLARELRRTTHFWSLDTLASHDADSDLVPVSKISPQALICADNVSEQTLADGGAVALLGIYEAAMMRGAHLVLAAAPPPEQLAATLPDLASRLASGTSYQLKALSEENKPAALQLRARSRGFELEDNVVEFIMRHFARDTASLFGLLDRIDSASLSRQRKVTIPFVRDLLS